MPLPEPQWWYEEPSSWQARLLAPLGWLYGGVTAARFKIASPFKAPIPVLCVGNFTAGGTGKTPFSIALAEIVRELGHEPVFLTRGYGGTLEGPVAINPERHTCAECGDEPLLLAASAATVVARNRRLGAEFIGQTYGPKAVVIMDDGLQNPAVHKDLSIALVDRRRSIGNGSCIPAGPLRAPLEFQTGLIGAVAVTGAQSGQVGLTGLTPLKSHFQGPILVTRTEPAGDTAWLKDRRILAFSGIANPERFFALLEGLGASVVERQSFTDHHVFTDAEASAISIAAASRGLQLVTTAKDFVRLSGSRALANLRDATRVLSIQTVFDKESREQLVTLVAKALKI